MSKYDPIRVCVKCRCVIEWMTIAGGRVFTMTSRGTAHYTTRCGCGEVKRMANGRRAR